jgi:spermidine synthase
VAEALIGVTAFLTPQALDAATGIYRLLADRWPDNLALITTARVLAGFVVLFVPTVLMGLTLPVLAASDLFAGPRRGAYASALYAANTAGALVGTLATGYVLIGGIGMSRTFLVAALINVTVGLGAIVLAQRSERAASHEIQKAPEHGGDDSVAPALRRAVALTIFVTGFASLALEVVWFRILLQYLTATTYAFTTMLATVLGGIAVGGAIGARRLVRSRDVPRALASVLAWTGAAVVMSQVFLAWSYNAGWRTSGLTQASAAAILPAAILMGVAFPMALRLGALPDSGDLLDRRVVARRIGRLYALNVGGAIAGALAGGFVILPLLGSRLGLQTLAAVYAAIALVVLLAAPGARRVRVGFVLALAAFAGFIGLVRDPFEAARGRRHGIGYREIWRDEGAQTSVSVEQTGRLRVMFIDGVHQASDDESIVRLHRVIGHLAGALHPDPRRVLVVGLGGGATPGALSYHPNAAILVVELAPGVVEAATHFRHINDDVLRQPNVRIRQDDGRNFLTLSRESFDVITADTIHPENAGAGNLYSREYFRLARARLAPNGLVVQWIGHRPEAHYKLIMRTFLDVFPNATLWFDGTLLVGTQKPLRVDAEVVDRLRSAEFGRHVLDRIGLTGPDVLRSWYTGGPDEMRRFVGPGPILTDDRPLLEYHRSIRQPNRDVDVAALRGNAARVFGP